MSRATDNQMDALHGLLSKTMFDEIEAYVSGQRVAIDKEGKAYKLPIPPALLGQAIKFLKDNGVDTPGRSNKGVDRLAKLLSEYTPEDEPA
jgi:hypothetical protein